MFPAAHVGSRCPGASRSSAWLNTSVQDALETKKLEQRWLWPLVLYAFLCPSELVEDGICGLTDVPRSTLAVDRKTNFC